MLAAFSRDILTAKLAHRYGLPIGTVKTRIRGGMIDMRQQLEHAV